MNAKTVLKKLVALISENEVALTYAKLKDGTIVESETFDVGQKLFVVSEDGTKTPAPDGEHELALKDEAGNENLIKVITKEGIIEERENVELEADDTEKAKELPEEENLTEMAEEETPSDKEEEKKEEPTEMGDMKKRIEEMAYRIEEMEKKIEEMGKQKMEEEVKEEDEEELPKLDGAPVEAKVKKFSLQNTNKNTNVAVSPQERVLQRLYNKN